MFKKLACLLLVAKVILFNQDAFGIDPLTYALKNNHFLVLNYDPESGWYNVALFYRNATKVTLKYGMLAGKGFITPPLYNALKSIAFRLSPDSTISTLVDFEEFTTTPSEMNNYQTFQVVEAWLTQERHSHDGQKFARRILIENSENGGLEMRFLEVPFNRLDDLWSTSPDFVVQGADILNLFRPEVALPILKPKQLYVISRQRELTGKCRSARFEGTKPIKEAIVTRSGEIKWE